MYRFSNAVVRRFPKNIILELSIDINSNKLHSEFNEYVAILRKFDMDIIELAPENDNICLSFTGDYGFTIDNICILSCLADKVNRLYKMQYFQSILSKDLNLHLHSFDLLVSDNILFSGSELFIGYKGDYCVSEAQNIAQLFDFSCSLIKMSPNLDNLKECLNFLPELQLLIYNTNLKNHTYLLKQIETQSSFKYRKLAVSFDTRNIISFKGHIFYCDDKIIKNDAINELNKVYPCHRISFEELSKIGATLSRLIYPVWKMKV